MVKVDKKNMAIAIGIALIIIVSGSLTYLEITKKPERKKEEVEEPKIDDRISPLTNQAIFLEIHRIRKKGIIDQMYHAGWDIFDTSPTKSKTKEIQQMLDGIRPGFGWDKKPSFSYIAILDNFEWKGRQTYNTWDTGYMNQEIFRNVEEEKPTTDVVFKIVEKTENKKIIGQKTQIKEMESFKVTYDFRTGRWSGDDYFNDSDGYGHYNGSNYEIWFSLYQTQADGDNIPWWVEVNVLGTNPLVDDSKNDPDHDGIPTSWEWKWGYDPFKWNNHTFLDPDKDGLQNTEEYKMEKWLANPYQPEIYLEADYMQQTPKKFLGRDGWDGWKHVFYEESQQMLIERFNQHGITLHIDDGRMGGGGDILPFGRGNGAYSQESGVVAGFYNNNFSDERKGIFRYLVIAYGGGWCHPQDSNHYYDCMCVPHNRNFYIKQLNFALSERTKRIGQAIQVLHEMGHSLGIYYGGVDNLSARNGNPPDYPWWDYVSVMNYDYFRQRYFDYSNGKHGEHDVNDWAAIDLTFFQRPSWEMEGLGS